jgi:hypothetical protein
MFGNSKTQGINMNMLNQSTEDCPAMDSAWRFSSATLHSTKVLLTICIHVSAAAALFKSCGAMWWYVAVPSICCLALTASHPQSGYNRLHV